MDETLISTHTLLQQIKELENKVKSIVQGSKINNLIDKQPNIQWKVQQRVETMTPDHLEPKTQRHSRPIVDIDSSSAQPKIKQTDLIWTRNSKTPEEQRKKPPFLNAVC